MGKRSKKKHNAFRNNPPRGPPGILVLCETGRENKCQREALEILRYYFYGGESDDVSSAKNNNEKSTGKEEQSLSLEEEIALLKKGASADAVLSGISDPEGKHQAPFRLYDTGCKGTAFIMCTVPDSELISTTISTAKSMHNYSSDGNSKQEKKGETTESIDPVCLGKRKLNVDAAPTVKIETKKKQKKLDESGTPKWDPIETVQSIFRDIREQNTEAPRSRFVSRMIPMQATCFASVEEIMVNASELIKDFLMPEVNKNGNSGDKLPSFKIEFKRRNCNHIRRDEIVEGIANIVQDLTKEHWNEHKNGSEKDGNAAKQLFRVDLDNPDYSIIIELCRTLCGMSVVANAKSYKNFNLMVVQEEATVDSGCNQKS